ncbi:hypothetical protein FRC10_007519 [Ceratobasidium sp. 414]|nr:hypothetical protein FRC10_007519 [Ceratobasidium sp. 414]
MPGGGESECVFSFPEMIDLTRFEMYAYFVKVARAHVPYTLRFQGGESSAVLPRPLLSNLQRLIVKTYGSADVAAFGWVPSLLTPCLLQLEFRSIYLEESAGEDTRREHSWMEQGACFELIKHISRKCPYFDTLRIFPGAPNGSDTGVGSVKYDGITGLKHLRTLELGAIEVDQELFLALAQLPYLETLSLHTDNSQRKQTKNDAINIPDNSFLALRQLALHGLSESTTQRICTVSPLIRHLVKASFIFPERRLHNIVGQRDFSLLVAQCLDHKSPSLVDLTVFSPGMDSCLALYLPATLDVFKRTPLRRLRLDRARLKSWGDVDELDSDDSDIDEEVGRVETQWRDFLVTVPHLEELHLDLQVLLSRHLPVIALTLPSLRLLALMGVLLEDGEVSVSRAATQPITIRCPFYVDTDGQNGWADASRVARYIFHLPRETNPVTVTLLRYIYKIWPNAQFEVKKSMSWIYFDEPLDDATEMIAGFNKAFDLLRSSGN